MVTRYFNILNFRNIGCNDDGSDRNELYTNFTHTKNKQQRDKFTSFSGLSILIGPNNIGKTNVLDAIRYFGDGQALSKKERPDFHSVVRPIILEYFVRDDDSENIFSIIFDERNVLQKVYKFEDGAAFDLDREIKAGVTFLAELKSALLTSISKVINYPNSKEDLTNLCNSIDGLDSLTPDVIDSISNNFQSLQQFVPEFYKKYRDYEYIELLNRCLDYVNHAQKFVLKYGIDPIPNIVSYDSDDITKETINQMIITKEEISVAESMDKLILRILSYLGYTLNDVKSWYDGEIILDNISNEIKRRLPKLNNDFNKMFPQNGKSYKYSFELIADDKSIQLKIEKNGKYVKYEKQSTGFKWFFAFYNHFILTRDLPRGSIILMDEPCKTLHPNGIKEFRNILLSTANSLELTFVVATHSPFLIDVNNLDEVRILSEKDNSVSICNSFNKAPILERNFLKPIADALLTENNTLYDNRNSKIIFVEGITDYIYLNAFKSLMPEHESYKNLIFFPIGGIPKGNEDPLNCIEKMETIAFLLVDGDETGNEYKNKFKDKKNIKVVSLSDINSKFCTIETLFSTEEQEEKYGFYKDKKATKAKGKYNKDFLFAEYIKQLISCGVMKEETTGNFKSVLDYFSECQIDVEATFRCPSETETVKEEDNSSSNQN